MGSGNTVAIRDSCWAECMGREVGLPHRPESRSMRGFSGGIASFINFHGECSFGFIILYEGQNLS